MILAQRDILIEGDFAFNLQLLQSYPHIDLIQLLKRAMALRDRDRHRSHSIDAGK